MLEKCLKNAYVNKRRIAPQGYVTVTKPLAKILYNKGVSIVLAGNNVNNYHIFNGWHLGCTIEENQKDIQSFEQLVNSFMFYLDNELGKYPVFYVKREDIPV